MAEVRDPSGSARAAHANAPRAQERRRTVTAPVSGIPSVGSLPLCTPHPSEPSERRISIPVGDGIGRRGGRPRRVLTGLLVCGLCDAELRASPRSRHETRWRPVPGSKLNEAFDHQYSQPRYVCPNGRHLAILALPLEQIIEAAVAADRPGETLAGAILRIGVAPGRPGCNHFDPYRVRIVWRDPSIRPTPLRRLWDQAGG